MPHPAIDTISCDSVTLQRFLADRAYDYDRELIDRSEAVQDESLLDAITRWINKLFESYDYDPHIEDRVDLTWLWITLGVLAVLGIAFFLWKNRHIFFRNKNVDSDLDFDIEQDNIYGIDFDSEIRDALAAADYRAATRLYYLSTLKRLDDAGRINWQPHTTPSQYSRELNDDNFTRLTAIYIRVRYGGRYADADTCRCLEQLREQVQPYIEPSKGGERS